MAKSAAPASERDALTMVARAKALIAALGLQPHPEGGHYRELFRAGARVRTDDGRERAALTAILFLLAAGECSRWHRVRADETWHHHEGAPLQLLQFDDGGAVQRSTLGPAGDGTTPLQIVPAGHWQAARSLGDYTLVSCCVGPGFEFADFELLADQPSQALRRPLGLADFDTLL